MTSTPSQFGFLIVRYKPSESYIGDELQKNVNGYWAKWQELKVPSGVDYEVKVVDDIKEWLKDNEHQRAGNGDKVMYVFVPMDYIVLQHPKHISNWLQTNQGTYYVRFRLSENSILNHVVVAPDVESAKKSTGKQHNQCGRHKQHQ